MGWGLVLLDLPLTPPGEVLQPPTGSLEGIADRHVHILVRARRCRLTTDRDVRGARNRNVDADFVDIALVVAMLRTAYDDAHRRDPIVELLQLVGFLPDASINRVGMADVLEGNLDWCLHGGVSRQQYGAEKLVCEITADTRSAH